MHFTVPSIFIFFKWTVPSSSVTFSKKKRTDFCRQTVGISIFYGRGWNAGFLPVETEIHGAWNSLVAQTSSGVQGSQLGAQNGFQLSQTVLETLKAGSYDACDV